MLHFTVEGTSLQSYGWILWQEKIDKSKAFMLSRTAPLNHEMKPTSGNWHEARIGIVGINRYR